MNAVENAYLTINNNINSNQNKNHEVHSRH